MKAPIFDLTGNELGKLELPKDLFSVEVNPVVLAQYIRVYLQRQRQVSAKSLTRGEVSGTTAKVWKQKGTGRARHGSGKAPIFVGGGKAHGPRGNQNYTLRMSKTQRRLALLGALAAKANQVYLIDGLDTVNGKTKEVRELMSKSLLKGNKGRVTLVLESSMPKFIMAARNVDNLSVTQAARINPYEVMNSQTLVFTKNSLQVLQSLWSQE